jgi:hypothetical protein
LQLTLVGWWWAFWRTFHSETDFSYLAFVEEISISIAFLMAARFLSFELGEDKVIDLEEYFFQIKNPMFVFVAYAFCYLKLKSALSGSTEGFT